MGEQNTTIKCSCGGAIVFIGLFVIMIIGSVCLSKDDPEIYENTCGSKTGAQIMVGIGAGLLALECFVICIFLCLFGGLAGLKFKRRNDLRNAMDKFHHNVESNKFQGDVESNE